jgi:hypothetical protein
MAVLVTAIHAEKAATIEVISLAARHAKTSAQSRRDDRVIRLATTLSLSPSPAQLRNPSWRAQRSPSRTCRASLDVGRARSEGSLPAVTLGLLRRAYNDGGVQGLLSLPAAPLCGMVYSRVNSIKKENPEHKLRVSAINLMRSDQKSRSTWIVAS